MVYVPLGLQPNVETTQYGKRTAMAAPKKKTSKGKRDQRHAHWKRKAKFAAEKAMSMGKSILTGRAEGFVYPTDDTDDGDDE